MRGSAKIEYSNLQANCFATVSWPLTSVRTSPDNLKILIIETGRGEKHYLTVSGSTSAPSSRDRDGSTNKIKLHGKLGTSLKLKDGEHVIFSMPDETPPISVTSAKVSCCSRDDWEILETNSNYVANHLLNQLRVVYPGLEFPFWLSKSMVVHLKIDDITPSGQYGILSANSEIIIPSIASTSSFVRPSRLKSHQKLRVHPATVPNSVTLHPTEVLLFSNPTHAFTYKSHLQLSSANSNVEQESITVHIAWDDDDKCQNESGDGGKASDTKRSRPCFIKLFFLDNVPSTVAKELFPYVSIPCIYLHSELIRETRLPLKSWVWVSSTTEESEHLPFARSAPSNKTSTTAPEENRAEFIGFQQILEDCISFVKASLSLSQHRDLLQNLIGVGQGSLLIHGGPGYGKTSLATSTAQLLARAPYFVHWDLVNCAKLRGKKPENIGKEIEKSFQTLSIMQPALIILDDFDVLSTPPKTTTEQSDQEAFLQFKINETLLETLVKYKGSRIAVICTVSSNDATNGYWQSRPGFHFFQKVVKISPPNPLERLDIFISNVQRYHGGTGSRDSSSKNRRENVDSRTGNDQEYEDDDELKREIGLALGTIHEQNATPQFLVNVAKKWGAYLGSLDGDNRRGVGHVPSSGPTNVLACAPSPQINKINKWNENVNEQMKAFNEILQEEIRFSGDLAELKNSRDGASSSMRNKISWNSIGGLNGVKEELKKILEWPVKYPQFFKNAPVRLPCGILFYGYPGTGKSLMGLAVQSIVNVKFIHVKGPELLSKYIGASEQAVQDVFARARESRPCILFFDEFDSLVPRRGHDSSGVTDRVVNQFLSEMDGIDGGLGEGVYLIAATSRPDLIDPAVLRPGRLDRHLFFNFPSQEERKEILKVISSQMSSNLEDESDWNEISRLTEGFTGADLNSLMFSAQLSVVHKYLGQLDGDDDDGSKSKSGGHSPTSSAAATTMATQEIKVTKESLLSALQDFKPSVHGKELRKFQAIYRGFISSKSGASELSSPLPVGTKQEEEEGSENPSWRMEMGKRATLA